MKCKNCGVTFIATRNWQDFCRNSCRMEYHNKLKQKQNPNLKLCKGCGIEFETNRAHQVFHDEACKRLHRKANYKGKVDLPRPGELNPDELGENLRLWRTVVYESEKFKNQTHCAYCGLELRNGQAPFCNNVCQKHYIFDRKKPNDETLP